MGVLIKFLVDNFIYFVFIAILLVLALIGYIIDTSRMEKAKKEKEEEEGIVGNIPIASLDSSVKIGESVNKMTMDSNAGVNPSVTTVSFDTPPIAPKIEEKK